MKARIILDGKTAESDNTPTTSEELERLLNAPQPGGTASLFVWASISLAFLTVLSVIALTIVRPEQDNTAAIALIVGIMGPLITALIAAAIQQVHLLMNSRLSQLVKFVAKASRAEGNAEGKLSGQEDVANRTGHGPIIPGAGV